MDVASWPAKAKIYLLECLRVLRITKKPTAEEFKTTFKVSGIGMLIIGLVGFVVILIKELLL